MEARVWECDGRDRASDFPEADLERFSEGAGRRSTTCYPKAFDEGIGGAAESDANLALGGESPIDYENDHFDEEDHRVLEGYENHRTAGDFEARRVEQYGVADRDSHSDEEGLPLRYERQMLGAVSHHSPQTDSEVSEDERELQSVECEQHMKSMPLPTGVVDHERSLTRSGSTESGFHNHTDRAEDDLNSEYVALVEEHDMDNEDVYSLEFRPEAEEYTEHAEAEHSHMPSALMQSHDHGPIAANCPIGSSSSEVVLDRELRQPTRQNRQRPVSEPEGSRCLEARLVTRPNSLPQNLQHPRRTEHSLLTRQNGSEKRNRHAENQTHRSSRQHEDRSRHRAAHRHGNARYTRRSDPQAYAHAHEERLGMRSELPPPERLGYRQAEGFASNRQSLRHSDPLPTEQDTVMVGDYTVAEEAYRVFHPRAEPAVEEHVYEEIGETDATTTTTQFDREDDSDGGYDKEVLGARLHHYDVKSDSDSDGGRQESEYATYDTPNVDSDDNEEDIDQIVAEVKQSLSSKSLDHLTHEMPECEQEASATLARGNANARTYESGMAHEHREAISLALKDIQEAIAEVKTKTVRSPYTPEEPAEPIWVMRKEHSPMEEMENNLGSFESPASPSSPTAVESMRRQQRSDLNAGSPPEASRDSLKNTAFPSFVDDTMHQEQLSAAVPGPCDPEDLIDGIIFAANYLGSTQLLSDKNPSKNVRMLQAQEAVGRIKASEGESQPMTEVDLFISTQRIKVLNADTQETMMDHALRTISYIADIGNIVVLMARRRLPRSSSQEAVEASHPAPDGKRQYKMICHVFESEDAQLIAQSIGQAFSVAYQEFLRANGINPEDLSQKDYSDLLNTQEMYNDDLIHFSKSENSKEIILEKQKGEILGITIVESGWGSILPTVIIANLMNGGPATRSGKLNIGDQIMSINGTSLVGLPLSTCQTIIKGLKNQTTVKLNIVSCPPVTTVLIKRPDLKYQLGFSVQNGIICSLMRGGIAERGGVRVGHRIIEINGQSVVATPHEKIVHALSNAVGEIHMKTMPAAMYRLLTGQEQPVYL
uniref:amyloid-beta A4 precursor protein-binding family A member 1-like isoform X2 n=1 Tax=Myxine glutinosa TaxID=7769 RepID=UPI00358EED6F